MILVEEGKLRLDDPVDKFLPELKDRKVLRSLESPLDDTVPANRPITMRDLLTFRAGLGAVMVFPSKYPIQKAMEETGVAAGPFLFSGGGNDEFMKRIGGLPLRAPAGREVAVPHRSRHPRRTARTRLGQVARRFPARADFRSARHEGYGLPCPGRADRPPRHRIHNGFLERPAGDLRRGARRKSREPARVRIGRRWICVHRRRLPRLRPHDVEQGHARERANSVAALD